MNARWLVIPLTLLVALILLMLPLPELVEPFRPDWVAMVALYWAFALPRRFGLLAAWIVGLLLDATMGTLLGQHALAMVIIVAIAIHLHQRVRVAPLAQQAIIVMTLLMLQKGIVLWTSGIINQAPDNLWHYFASPVVALLFWPVVLFILRDLRRRFQVS